MPSRELSRPSQVVSWLEDWGEQLEEPAELILIGSAGLLWHVAQTGSDLELPEMSMDVDPITESEEIAELAYNSMIGSEFEAEHGWHVNLMPDYVLREFPENWKDQASTKTYGNLTVVIPQPVDLMTPKLARGEPRDLAHLEFCLKSGIISQSEIDTIASR